MAEILKPQLAFTPPAWAKVIAMLEKDENEAGGFGVTGSDDPFLVTDILVPKQEVTAAFVSLDDDHVAELLELLTSGENPLQPWQFMRIWIHTHPRGVHNPSGQDETTFKDVLGMQDYSVMFIIAKDYTTYARLQVKKPCPFQSLMETAIAWRESFQQYDEEPFKAMLEKHISKRTHTSGTSSYASSSVQNRSNVVTHTGVNTQASSNAKKNIEKTVVEKGAEKAVAEAALVADLADKKITHDQYLDGIAALYTENGVEP